ncbi:hypothetical protein L218DRAFT_956077 [Marasmius fiardii PR-910]|nr:hypothetical protein L218DRAFT_956077 [Marasmius fiardii PR-910]
MDCSLHRLGHYCSKVVLALLPTITNKVAARDASTPVKVGTSGATASSPIHNCFNRSFATTSGLMLGKTSTQHQDLLMACVAIPGIYDDRPGLPVYMIVHHQRASAFQFDRHNEERPTRPSNSVRNGGVESGGIQGVGEGESARPREKEHEIWRVQSGYLQI